MKNHFDKIKQSIMTVLDSCAKNPKRLLTEADLEAWIYRGIIDDVSILSENSELGIHAQVRFLDSQKRLMIIPDLAVFKLQDYSIDESGGLFDRKAYTFWGSSILIELKLGRGCRRIGMIDLLSDIDKLAIVRDIHYANSDEDYEYFPLFVYFSRETINSEDEQKIRTHAQKKEVHVIINSPN